MKSEKLVIALLGSIGSGKTTRAEAIVKKTGFVLVSAGQLVRDFVKKNTPAGQKAAKLMSQGKLVPNWLTNKLIKQELTRRVPGFVLDGFPRSMPQAKFFRSLLNKKKWRFAVVVLKVSKSLTIKRLSSRVFCPKGGEPFNLPKKICPKHKVKLIRRPDDEPAAIKARIEVFTKQTAPVIKYFKKYTHVISVQITGGSIKENNSRVLGDLIKNKIINDKS